MAAIQETRNDEYKNTDKKEELFSDFLCNLDPHPNTEDVVRFVNEQAVKRSIRNLLLTNRGERLFQPNIGSDINRILFENITAATAQALKGFIIDTITSYEKRCMIISVDVIAKEELNAYDVNIIFSIINKVDPINLNVTLYRVR